MLKKRSGERQLDINGKPFAWRLTTTGVLIRLPNDTTLNVSFEDFFPDRAEYDVQHALENGNMRVPPGRVADYIRQNLVSHSL